MKTSRFHPSAAVAFPSSRLKRTSLFFRTSSHFQNLINTISNWELIQDETRENLDEIRRIRNRYVHPSELEACNPENDSFRMLTLLCQVINREVGPGPNARYTIVEGSIRRQR